MEFNPRFLEYNTLELDYATVGLVKFYEGHELLDSFAESVATVSIRAIVRNI